MNQIFAQHFFFLLGNCRLSKVPAHAVRGALLTKESGSSFPEVHKVRLSEPTHMEDEDEVEDQEDEVEDEKDCEVCRVESRRESK